MILNYLKLTFRHLKKLKITSLVYVAGLSVGLAFSILVFLYIVDEFSYDQFHKNGDRIYSIVETDHFYGYSSRLTPVPLAGELSSHCVDIDNFARIAGEDGVVQIGEALFNERIHMVDQQFFELFSFPLKSGNPRTALQSKNSLVITESYAKKFFGEGDPSGESIAIILGDQKVPFQITAVAFDPPSNSTIQFNLLTNINNLNTPAEPDKLFNWNRGNVATYLLLKDDKGIEYIETEILALCKERRGGFYDIRKQYSSLVATGETFTYRLQELKDIHLESAGIFGSSGGDIKKIYLLAIIAVCILAIGIVNFLNISLVRISGRSLEIGLRKTFGANKNQFIHQFWTESIIIVFISFMVGAVLAFLLLPAFNGLVGKSLSPGSFARIPSLLAFAVLVVVTGIVSGSYPALVMTGFRITDIFKGKIKLGSRSLFQKALLLFQYVVSIFFIITAFTVARQLKFIEDYDLGFQDSGVVVVQLQGRNSQQNMSVLRLLKDRASTIKSIQNISGCETSPNRTVSIGTLDIEGKRVDAHMNRIDYEYISTMKMNIIEGRDFSANIPADTFSVIVNQKLAKEFSDSPVGKIIRTGNLNNCTVIGVVKDYNFLSLRDEIKPTLLSIGPSPSYNFALLRIDAGNVSQTIRELEDLWKEIQPEKVFLFSFLDDDLANFYREEKRLNATIKYSSLVIVIITIIGIFGLTLFNSNQRIREFGIRKVVGASYLDIIGLVIKDILVISALAFIIALPISFNSLSNWLERFAYRTSLDYIPFLLAGLIVIAISVLTVSYIAVKAALINPVESLKNS